MDNPASKCKQDVNGQCDKTKYHEKVDRFPVPVLKAAHDAALQGKRQLGVT
jgi:hypothetical protein